MTTSHNIGQASAKPMRAFFVEMLVKDVSLNSAILDLVDNCIDGGTRLRRKGDLDGLFVNITLSDEGFVIEDNCGGIDVETAREYAFKFGRDPHYELTAGGVGLFGVGMKRAIFKLGKIFKVISRTQKEEWEIDVKVRDWLRDTSDSWTFPMEDTTYASEQPVEKSGTIIEINDLNEGVATQFSNPLFASRLAKEIASKHEAFLRRHVSISINGHFITGSDVTFKYVPNELIPTHLHGRSDGVNYQIIAGIGESDSLAAGWYIYCNGRMIVKADQTELTGWGEMGLPTSGIKIPRMHHQFARFRGCTYFESNDPRKLPWKTTKDGIDVEQPLFQQVKQKMQAIARPVIDFLNDLDRETEEINEEKKVLNALISRAIAALPSELPASNDFVYIKRQPQPKPPQKTRIQFDRPIDQVERMKKHLHIYSAKGVGEYIFDWYLENECSDE